MSIWLNQAVKGYRDKTGNAVTNAHILGLFHRVSKLLFYKIKPVFVFDGKAPDLKKETLQRRRIRKGDASKKARIASVKILDKYANLFFAKSLAKSLTLKKKQYYIVDNSRFSYVRSQAIASQLKQQTHAVNKILAKGQEGLHDVLSSRAQKKDKDLFELPPIPEPENIDEIDSDDDQEFREDLIASFGTDIHHMNVKSQAFKSLPKEIQYEVLSELNERRKQSSWGKMHEMPQTGSSFSGFQMQRLINRSNVIKTMRSVGKEIGEENAGQMDSNLFVGDVEGIKKAKAEAKRVQSSSTGQHFVYLKDLKTQASSSSKTSESEIIANADDEVQILEPTVVKLSNRSGGIRTIKEEIIDADEEEDDIYQEEILKVIQSEARMQPGPDPLPGPSNSIIMSDSSDSDSFEEVSSSTANGFSIEIKPGDKLDDGDDLFADIFDSDERKSGQNVTPVQETQKTVEEVENMAEKMKHSEHLYLKIASKYVEPEPKVDDDEVIHQADTDELFDELDLETNKLIAEMKTNAKEEKLMKIKDLDQLQTEETKRNQKLSKAQSSSKESNDDSRLLNSLGVKQFEQEEYKNQVEAETSQVYGDSVEGFSRSKRDANVISESPQQTVPLFDQETMDKLDNEEEEFSRDELMELQNRLAEEQEGLIAERGQLDRLAASITDQMYAECQELLQMFGIPWIVSPGEAEAQCAFLDMNGLTHGTITDDSDIWVFGGQNVFKNFFNQDKHCERFTSADVSKHFGLSRERLIMLAMLTGSDYTDGIESVGPVTALEIIAEFAIDGRRHDLQPLSEFKIWWDTHHKNLTLPPGSKLREKLRKLQLPETFPSDRIRTAYINPDVDNSTEKFTWAIPNFVDIRDYAADKFGWTRGKIDEIIKPVIKKMSIKTSQERIDNFFQSSRITLPEKGHLQSSKRVKDAIDRVLGKSKASSDESKTKIITKRKREKKSDECPKESKAKKKDPPAKKVEDVTVVLPPKDWKKEDELKQKAAKEKALAVMRQQQKKDKKKAVKNKRYQVSRKVLMKHNLSESESD